MGWGGGIVKICKNQKNMIGCYVTIPVHGRLTSWHLKLAWPGWQPRWLLSPWRWGHGVYGDSCHNGFAFVVNWEWRQERLLCNNNTIYTSEGGKPLSFLLGGLEHWGLGLRAQQRHCRKKILIDMYTYDMCFCDDQNWKCFRGGALLWILFPI